MEGNLDNIRPWPKPGEMCDHTSLALWADHFRWYCAGCGHLQIYPDQLTALRAHKKGELVVFA